MEGVTTAMSNNFNGLDVKSEFTQKLFEELGSARMTKGTDNAVASGRVSDVEQALSRHGRRVGEDVVGR